MKTHKDRERHFSLFRSPTPNEEGYEKFREFFKKQHDENPKLAKELEKKFTKASSVLNTQLKNGIGLSADKELRHFLKEYNNRLWKYGFGAMPPSFSVLEAFYKWNLDLFLFELNEEEEYFFSLFDFIDFITSEKCSHSIDYFIENVEENIIYSYNILNELKEITFKTLDSKEFVVSSISFIRRANEVSMLIVAGEICNVADVSKKLPNLDSYKKVRPYIEISEDRKREAVKLLDQNDVWKQLVYIRINLDTKTIDSKYIQKDNGDSFDTISDDIGMWLNGLKNEADIVPFIESQLKQLHTYEPLFEIAQKCLYLPEYFDIHEDNIINEEHPTELINETLRKEIAKKIVSYSSNHFFKSKDVWVLDQSIIPENKHLLLEGTELSIEKDGYWKYLEPGKIGADRNGNPIHNRTWVEKTLSWYQTPEKNKLEVSISNAISINSGFIYMLRNPAHALNIFKIGLTTLTVEERAKQLSGTPSPDKFTIINRWQVADCVLAEKLIHEKLDAYRLNAKREFFEISIEKAIEMIIPIIKKVNEKNAT